MMPAYSFSRNLALSTVFLLSFAASSIVFPSARCLARACASVAYLFLVPLQIAEQCALFPRVAVNAAPHLAQYLRYLFAPWSVKAIIAKEPIRDGEIHSSRIGPFRQGSPVLTKARLTSATNTLIMSV